MNDQPNLLRWTPEMDAMLRDLYDKHMPMDAIGRRIGVGENRTNARAKALGLVRSRARIYWTTEMDAALRDLHGRHVPQITIAKRIGVSERTVRKRERVLGLVSQPGAVSRYAVFSAWKQAPTVNRRTGA